MPLKQPPRRKTALTPHQKKLREDQKRAERDDELNHLRGKTTTQTENYDGKVTEEQLIASFGADQPKKFLNRYGNPRRLGDGWPKRCDVCEAELISQVIYDGHFAGKKHKKAMEKLKLAEKVKKEMSQIDEQTRKDIGYDDPDGIQVNPETGIRFCAICDIHFNFPQIEKTHMMGKRHRDNLRAHKRGYRRRPVVKVLKHKNVPGKCDVCGVNWSNDALMLCHVKGKKHIAQMKKCGVPNESKNLAQYKQFLVKKYSDAEMARREQEEKDREMRKNRSLTGTQSGGIRAIKGEVGKEKSRRRRRRDRSRSDANGADPSGEFRASGKSAAETARELAKFRKKNPDAFKAIKDEKSRGRSLKEEKSRRSSRGDSGEKRRRRRRSRSDDSRKKKKRKRGKTRSVSKIENEAKGSKDLTPTEVLGQKFQKLVKKTESMYADYEKMMRKDKDKAKILYDEYQRVYAMYLDTYAKYSEALKKQKKGKK